MVTDRSFSISDPGPRATCRGAPEPAGLQDAPDRQTAQDRAADAAHWLGAQATAAERLEAPREAADRNL